MRRMPNKAMQRTRPSREFHFESTEALPGHRRKSPGFLWFHCSRVSLARAVSFGEPRGDGAIAGADGEAGACSAARCGKRLWRIWGRRRGRPRLIICRRAGNPRSPSARSCEL